MAEDTGNQIPPFLARFARITLWGFFLSFAGFVVSFAAFLIWYQDSERAPMWLTVTMPATFLAIFVTGPAYLAVHFFRGMGEWRRQRWRFSVFDLLGMMTIIAVVLSLVLYALRDTGQQ